MSTAAFSTVTAVTERSAGTYDAQLSPAWTITGRPNGGYLLAIVARAAVAAAAHPHVVAAGAHYLRPPQPGPVTVQTEILRAGRGATQVRGRMLQDAQPCVEALLTVGTLHQADDPTWQANLPDPPDGGDEVRVPGRTPTGAEALIMEQVDLRIDVRDLGFATGRPSGRGDLRGSLGLPGGEDFDPVSLLYAVDAMVPATFEIGPSGWVPTLELTAYVRALPAPGRVRLRQRARLVRDQRVDEDCYVWDSAGRLVAQCTQLAGIRFTDPDAGSVPPRPA